MLTTLEVINAKPGKLSDGRNGLSLLTKASGRQSWVVRFRDLDGNRRDKGIGSFPDIGLAQARHIAESIQADFAPSPQPKAAPVAFKAVARDVLAQNKRVWTSDRQAPDWWARLENHAAPLLDLPVNSITRAMVADVLLPIWHDKPSTARRLRHAIRQVMAHAMTYDETILANPAGDALDGVLHRHKASKNHHGAIPHCEVAEVLDIIDRSPSNAATRLCLRFLILTAVRSGEARGARWDEIDGDVWTVPAERMKTREAHRVPLSRQALEVVEAARCIGDDTVLFPTPRQSGEPLTRFAPRKLLVDNAIDSSVHGFRTSFRQWARATRQDWEASELALAHKIGSQVAQAYTRDEDLLDVRRPIMQEWADYITAV